MPADQNQKLEGQKAVEANEAKMKADEAKRLADQNALPKTQQDRAGTTGSGSGSQNVEGGSDQEQEQSSDDEDEEGPDAVGGMLVGVAEREVAPLSKAWDFGTLGKRLLNKEAAFTVVDWAAESLMMSDKAILKFLGPVIVGLKPVISEQIDKAQGKK